jgi:hypothetical protein
LDFAVTIAQALTERPVSAHGQIGGGASVRYPSLIELAVRDRLVFRPVPPGDRDSEGNQRLRLQKATVEVEISEDDWSTIAHGLSAGALTKGETELALEFAGANANLAGELLGRLGGDANGDWRAQLAAVHTLDELALVALRLIDQAQRALLAVEPLTEVQFSFSARAKAALALSWEALTKRGEFPLPPRGAARFVELNEMPCGALHFVSASDLDAGYLYTMGIAQSPEAQALKTMDRTYGLDGELIVPGQAVSPIPPFLALATRLFAVSVPTSSNISEEVQSIPIRNFAHPTAIDDLEPRRGGRLKPLIRPRNADEAITDLRLQLSRWERERDRKQAGDDPDLRLEGAAEEEGATVGAAYDVTGLNTRQIVHELTSVLADSELERCKRLIALYLDIESDAGDRVASIRDVVDAAKALGLRYVAVADDVEDSWLPNLLEYLEPDELNAVADYADRAGVIVIDGRPVDPVYTAATAAQRIQSVYSTLAVDILKMGMWLCLDALAARKVWREILTNPHIPSRMLLMPIGIVEPWSAFVDNRNPDRTARAILDPFEKIKFMIEEAALLKMPSLLTDTRHKATWVLLGKKSEGDEPHVRERFVIDSTTGETLGRTSDSAIPLLSWEQFMECERLARAAGVFLGQAGSIEVDQAFRIISETTYDAAKDERNPATAIWTAETERVLRTGGEGELGDLQSQRSSNVSAFLAVINRGLESHAKLEGWLRYLGENGRGEAALRQELDDRRYRLAQQLEACIAAQRHEPARYQERWDAYRADYVAYHNLIRDNFDRIRREVADAWAA